MERSNPLSKYSKIQEAGSIFRVGFAFSKSTHLYRSYSVNVRKGISMTVLEDKKMKLVSFAYHL